MESYQDLFFVFIDTRCPHRLFSCYPAKHTHPHTIMGTASAEASPPKQTEACRWWQEAGPDSITANLVISPLHHVPNCAPWHFSSMFIWVLAGLTWKSNKITKSVTAETMTRTVWIHLLEALRPPNIVITWRRPSFHIYAAPGFFSSNNLLK